MLRSCNPAVRAPGPFAGWAAVGWLEASEYFAARCGGNGIDWESGNTGDADFRQCYPGHTRNTEALRAARGEAAMAELNWRNVYEEVGSCSNPLGKDRAGGRDRAGRFGEGSMEARLRWDGCRTLPTPAMRAIAITSLPPKIPSSICRTRFTGRRRAEQRFGEISQCITPDITGADHARFVASKPRGAGGARAGLLSDQGICSRVRMFRATSACKNGDLYLTDVRSSCFAGVHRGCAFIFQRWISGREI